ncbi:MAG: 4,5-DOPA dioxygenase extradiol [Candidatus Micrarchaeia archaeon]|jgi:4,5-DOPA dioxygenase extradiol
MAGKKAAPRAAPAMPVLFIGHGSPENALLDNPFTRAMSRLGKELPRPRAILCISAHWLTEGTAAAATAAPKTIYDFYGFPPPLYTVKYPAPGSPELAARVQRLLKPIPAGLDSSWGLDHGTWSVLRHMYPCADVPVVQLSIDFYKPAQHHYGIGKKLAPLREEGILIIGSGNMVHNLRALSPGGRDAAPFDWAKQFDAFIKDSLEKKDHAAIADYQSLGQVAALAHPTPDHFYPLLYAMGAAGKESGVSYPYEGYEYGSLSMRAVRFD